MRRAWTLALLALLLAGGLSACGRKGALEPPPSSAQLGQATPRAAA